MLIVGVAVMKRMQNNAAELSVKEEIFDCGAGTNALEETGFCFCSDLHIRRMPVPWSRILVAVKEMKPSFLLLSGDLVNSADDLTAARDFIYCIAAGAGIPVIITPGNHDNGVASSMAGGAAAFADFFTSLPCDIRVLSDEYTTVGNVLIGGLNDVGARTAPAGPLVKQWAEKAAADGMIFILATHNADLLLDPSLAEIQPDQVCAVFSGHTHGGQIRMVRGLEFRALKNDVLPKRNIYYGRHDVGGYRLCITSGLGCALVRMRSGTRPELVNVRLRARKAGGAAGT